VKHIHLTNTEYLELYLAHDLDMPTNVLLPHEGRLVDNAVATQRGIYNRLIEAKIDVTGGDDWHDGAFRATDNDAKIVSQQMSSIAPYIGAPIVGYPDISEARATIGSRIVVSQGEYTYPIDIVGFRSGYPSDVKAEEFDDEVVGMSPDSPLARVLLGNVVGFSTDFEAGGRSMKVSIERIDQSAIMNYFMENVSVINILEQ